MIRWTGAMLSMCPDHSDVEQVEIGLQ